jgi:hypothetical protein
MVLPIKESSYSQRTLKYIFNIQGSGFKGSEVQGIRQGAY